MIGFLAAAGITFVACFIAIPILLAIGRTFGLYVIVHERECVVFELFGKVVAAIDQPGLHCPWLVIGPQAALVPFFGRRRSVDLRLDQNYLRSQPVNSEEGAPMGIGVWYEMYVSDPVAFLYKNADPRGSLRANVSNSTVRCLSNMKLGEMLENRHQMSRTVRTEVSEKSQEWGYRLGSTYIRKVHFRDAGMIKQIEQKVTNRLRQVTSAIQQDGANQVNLIHGTAARQAAVEFARAATMRPRIVGAALEEIARDPEICDALFQLLELEQLTKAPNLELTVLPAGQELLAQLAAMRGPVAGG
jgi:regulator of protease activity HflC (stomatin/prohibitin superfamily)